MGVIPNPKMAFIFPISCILALIFPILIKYFPKCVGKGSFPKSQIKSLILPRAVCFATSHPANHAICSFIDSSGYASGPIRRCLFIDYIINQDNNVFLIVNCADPDNMLP